MASATGKLLELEQDVALADLVKDWDFSIGKRFQVKVLLVSLKALFITLLLLLDPSSSLRCFVVTLLGLLNPQ